MQYQCWYNSPPSHAMCPSTGHTCREPVGRGDPVVGVFVRRARALLLHHHLKVQDEHDDGPILILHWHHIHQAQEAAACGEEGGSARQWHSFPSLLCTPSYPSNPTGHPFLLPALEMGGDQELADSAGASPTATASWGETEAREGSECRNPTCFPSTPQMTQRSGGSSAGGSRVARPGLNRSRLVNSCSVNPASGAQLGWGGQGHPGLTPPAKGWGSILHPPAVPLTAGSSSALGVARGCYRSPTAPTAPAQHPQQPQQDTGRGG